MNDPQSSQENVTSLLETLFPESELKLCDENIDSYTPCEDNSNTNCLETETCKSPGGFRGGMLPEAKRCQIQRHSRGRELPKYYKLRATRDQRVPRPEPARSWKLRWPEFLKARRT
ncbi:hypothetical protein J6590_072652 [Homalodisca vitripennis]|nr:hypothetical protein J6590_072652 [Homalodisca vitripennis]